jgi:hypothetical protein
LIGCGAGRSGSADTTSAVFARTFASIIDYKQAAAATDVHRGRYQNIISRCRSGRTPSGERDRARLGMLLRGRLHPRHADPQRGRGHRWMGWRSATRTSRSSRAVWTRRRGSTDLSIEATTRRLRSTRDVRPHGGRDAEL